MSPPSRNGCEGEGDDKAHKGGGETKWKKEVEGKMCDVIVHIQPQKAGGGLYKYGEKMLTSAAPHRKTKRQRGKAKCPILLS